MGATEMQLRSERGSTSERRPTELSAWRRGLDVGARSVLTVAAAAISALLIIIFAALLQRSWPIIGRYGLVSLLTGQIWKPHEGQFGYAPFIVGSVVVTLVAMVLAVIPAILSGVYLAEYTSSRARSIIKPMMDVLVGIPSVIYGLWGILAIVPLIREVGGPTAGLLELPGLAFTNPSGYSVLAAGMVLAVMVYPLIVAVVDEVMRSAPYEMREALLSLGATRWETTRTILFRSGLTGVLAAVVLGFSRAFGETLAVMMVVGNVAQNPHSLFDAAYPLPALIANNYGEMMSIPMYESALMGAALLLFVVIVCFNIAARMVINRVNRGN